MDNMLEKILILAKNRNASDLHMVVDVFPTLRINKDLVYLEEFGKLTKKKIETIITSILTSNQIEKLEKKRELDFSFSMNKIGRYRGNIFFEKGNMSIVLRLVNKDIVELKSLNLPRVVETFKNYSNGLVLITGPTGSGKTTTLAAIIEDINKNQIKNIITLEDPIEYLYESKKSLIRQRELGTDTLSFLESLKSVLRQDPDIILIGEMRDQKSIEAALTAAETGHLVFATLHTNGVVETINRVLESFSEEKSKQIRVQLSTTLRGVLSQELIKGIDNNMIALAEVMVITKAISNQILKGQTNQINTSIEMGAKNGMVTREIALKKLLEDKKITHEEYKINIGEYNGRFD